MIAPTPAHGAWHLPARGYLSSKAGSSAAALRKTPILPLNALEATQDPDGKWRRLVEQALHDEYQALFARIDALVLLAAPDLEEVLGWRTQQEHQLRDGGRGGMSDDEVIIFIQHYERLTRRILAEMPGYADLVINLDQQRRARSILRRGGVAS